MTLKLSQRTQELVERLFNEPDRSNVVKWLVDECGNNLPFCEKADEFSIERLRFAALKIGNGDALKLLEAIELAKQDWRDLLMWAEFGNDLEAHESWARGILGSVR